MESWNEHLLGQIPLMEDCKFFLSRRSRWTDENGENQYEFVLVCAYKLIVDAADCKDFVRWLTDEETKYLKLNGIRPTLDKIRRNLYDYDTSIRDAEARSAETGHAGRTTKSAGSK